MDRLEFGDFDKFLVSLGAVLLISSVAIPWLILREPFDLTIPVSQLDTFTPEAQSIVAHRQAFSAILIRAAPFVGAILFLLGCFCTARGLVGWRRRQRVYDRRTELEVEKLSLEIRQMTPSEVEQRAVSELQEIEEFEPGEPPEAPMGTRAQSYIQRERALASVLTSCLADRYSPSEYVRVGPVEFDLIMRTKNPREYDLLFEFKFVRKGFKYGWLKEASLKALYMSEIYEDHAANASAPFIVIIAPREVLKCTPSQEYAERIAHESGRLGRMVRLRFLAEEDLPSLSCADIEAIARI